MPVNATYTVEELINNHTLFPYYAAFIPPDRAEEIIDLMRIGNGDISYMKIGLISNSISLNEHFRFCPECFKEDIETYGEPYWHRIHQITGVFICSKHKIPIYNSKDLIRGGNRQRFIKPSIENCIVEKEIYYNDEFMKRCFGWLKMQNCFFKVILILDLKNGLEASLGLD